MLEFTDEMKAKIFGADESEYSSEPQALPNPLQKAEVSKFEDIEEECCLKSDEEEN